TKTLDQISTNLDSRRVPITKDVRASGEYPYYGASGIVDYVADYIFDEDTLLISEDGANLLARSTPIAFPASGKYWVNNHAHILKFENLTTQRFVELYLESIPLDGYITGAAQPKLNQKALNSIPIPIPPLPEQQRIVGILDEAFEGIATAKANAEKNLQNARALFESHLQSVFTQSGMGWVETTIGETCTLRSGTTVSPTLEKPIGDIPYLKVADMTFDGNEDQITTSSRFLSDEDVRESAIIPKGATIFPKRGGAILTNKKRITSLPICADLNIMAVIPSSQIDAGLLYFYFLNVDMRKLGTGSSIPQINNYDVAPLLISFPKSLATQGQIVSKFDSLREETQRLEAIYQQKLAALDELKKSLLHQAFTGEL
ncbi:MAG: restriction endonuclease subunit S, partial [Nitrospirota bacterium]